jgi:hypothetical protein
VFVGSLTPGGLHPHAPEPPTGNQVEGAAKAEAAGVTHVAKIPRGGDDGQVRPPGRPGFPWSNWLRS